MHGDKDTMIYSDEQIGQVRQSCKPEQENCMENKEQKQQRQEVHRERVSLAETARILGMSEQGVREHMKRGLFHPPIGYVTQPGNRKQYHIYRSMLFQYIGKGGEA